VLAMLLRLGTSVEEKLGAIFTVFDRNNSGYIDKMEYCDMMMGMLSNAAEQIDHDALMDDFARADTNGDGRISLDEFVQLAARFVGRWRKRIAKKGSRSATCLVLSEMA
jgi:Ca2+-binding EF-hand superfamily protein